MGLLPGLVVQLEDHDVLLEVPHCHLPWALWHEVLVPGGDRCECKVHMATLVQRANEISLSKGYK